MLAMYQETGAVRIFVGAGKPLPSWDGPILGPAVAAGTIVHLSFKTNTTAEVLAWVALKPAGVLVLLTKSHEPEQGPTEGDPTLEEFHAGWGELVPAFDGHPMRDEILLGPVYTRFWWQAHPGDDRWLPRVRVDFIGWDVYNNGTGYRAADDLLSIPRAIAARTGLPYLIAELGAQRLVGDTDGSGRTAWMRAMVAAAASDGALTVCWYHKDGWDLATGASDPERQTWQTIIREETPVATTAPDNLRAARTLLLDHLGPHGLEPLAVGIVGDPAHWGGYHCGRDRVLSRDYSVVESTRDSGGLSDFASALDVGGFAYGDHNLRTFSRWCVAQCEAGEPDTRDIREIIYSPDGQTVRRWDRLGRRTTGDSSHLSHTHFSFHRDAIKAGRDQTPLFRRYLTTIGLLEDDMPLTKADIPIIREALHGCPIGKTTVTFGQVLDLMRGVPGQVTAVRSDVAALAGRDLVDEQQVAAQLAPMILATLTPQAIADAIPAAQAKQVADELAARLRE